MLLLYNTRMNNELYTYTVDDLASLMKEWQQPAFRGKQIHEWIHRHHVSSYSEMTNLPLPLRQRLAERFPDQSLVIAHTSLSKDGSRKYLIRLNDGNLVETVGLPRFNPDGSLGRLSVCVSSQVGCPMECAFCATGREGLTRNLTAAEIAQQVALVQEDFNHRVSNVVVMGQGEPFLNYDEVLQALRTLNSRDDMNIGARHITLSTCGIINGIEKLSQEPEQFTLAVSLHSAVQFTRDSLMPRVASQPLPDLKRALATYNRETHRRVSLEYLLLDGINDDDEHLDALIDFCKGLLVHVNLLPMNPVEGAIFQPSSSHTAQRWIEELNQRGIETTMRVSRGSDINGACGQLKNSSFVS